MTVNMCVCTCMSLDVSHVVGTKFKDFNTLKNCLMSKLLSPRFKLLFDSPERMGSSYSTPIL